MLVIKRSFLCFIVLMFSQLAFAQTTGTLTVTGTNPEAFSITNTSDGTLSTTISFGTLTPGSGGTIASGIAQVRLRSNKAYRLNAQSTAISFTGPGTADNGDSISLSDLGFGVDSVDATGANVANATGHNVVGLFDYDPSLISVTNGLTPYVSGNHGTLNDITASTQILSGPRISRRGNLSTNNNFVLVTFTLATLAQYFTSNSSFSTTITLTMASQ